MAVANELLGVRELTRKLQRMASPKENAQALKASVAKPAQRTARVARANIGKISPGRTPFHRTYKGRIVSRGFAARNVVVRTSLNRAKTAAFAKIGVRREAFYAVNFWEVGSANTPETRWLRPAFDSQRSAMLAGVAESLRQSVLKYTTRSA